MPDVHFPALDLNLLRVFDALAEEGSVTRAGARLGLTQSAVSHALGRLRYALQDELFVRGPDGMRPTARAQEIAPRLSQGLHQLQLALAPTEFVPAETQRRFTIAASGYVCTVLMPLVVAEVRQAAPGVELRLQTPGETLGDDLQTGRIDIAIGGFGRTDPRFERETLLHESTVWVMRADHPSAALERQTVQSLAAIAHVIVATSEEEHAVDGRVSEGGVERNVILDDRGAFDEALAISGWRRNTGVTVQDAHSALAIVSQSDMAALVPRRMASAFAAQYGLKLFEPPYALFADDRPGGDLAAATRRLAAAGLAQRACLRSAAAHVCEPVRTLDDPRLASVLDLFPIRPAPASDGRAGAADQDHQHQIADDIDDQDEDAVPCQRRRALSFRRMACTANEIGLADHRRAEPKAAVAHGHDKEAHREQAVQHRKGVDGAGRPAARRHGRSPMPGDDHHGRAQPLRRSALPQRRTPWSRASEPERVYDVQEVEKTYTAPLSSFRSADTGRG